MIANRPTRVPLPTGSSRAQMSVSLGASRRAAARPSRIAGPRSPPERRTSDELSLDVYREDLNSSRFGVPVTLLLMTLAVELLTIQLLTVEEA